MKSILIFLTVFVTLVLVWGCSKETTPTLVYPTSFTFNTPSLEERSVYRIDSSYVYDPATNKKNLVWKFKKLGDTLGSYDISNPDIADTLNFIIRKNFSNSMISKITLLSANQMEIEYSRLMINDTLNPLYDNVEFLTRDTFDYQQVGNILNPGMYINNDSREIYICNEFIFGTKKLADGTFEKKYYQNSCNGPDAIASLERFVSDVNLIKYDTASVEYVNYIFSSYK